MTIQSLTPEQRARIPGFFANWTGIVLSHERVDRQLAEQSIQDLYKHAGFAAPRIVWRPGPASGMCLEVFLSMCDSGNLAYVLRNREWLKIIHPPYRPPGSTSLREAVQSDMAIAMWGGEPAMLLSVRLLEPTLLTFQQLPETVITEIETAGQERASRGWSIPRLCPLLEAVQAEVITQANLSLQWVTEWGVSSVLTSALHPVAGWWSYSAARLASVWIGTALDVARIGGGLVGGRNDLFMNVVMMAPWMDYLAEVLHVPVDRSIINLAKNAGWCWASPDRCVMFERPPRWYSWNPAPHPRY